MPVDGLDTFHDAPSRQADDTEIVARILAICDEFEAYGYRRAGAALRHRRIVVNAKKRAAADAGTRIAAPAPQAIRRHDRQRTRPAGVSQSRSRVGAGWAEAALALAIVVVAGLPTPAGAHEQGNAENAERFNCRWPEWKGACRRTRRKPAGAPFGTVSCSPVAMVRHCGIVRHVPGGLTSTVGLWRKPPRPVTTRGVAQRRSAAAPREKRSRKIR